MEVMGSGNKLVVGPGAVVIDLSKTDPPAKTLQLFFLVQGSDAGDTHLEAIDWQTADTGTSSTSITSKASATRAGPIFDAKIEGAIRAVRISTSKPLFLRGICAAG
jgi:hypothetical protein